MPFIVTINNWFEFRTFCKNSNLLSFNNILLQFSCKVQLFTIKHKFSYTIGFQREKKCHKTIPVQTETLSECFVPAWGISMAKSQ